ncbi:MAG: methylenetetrahydrofolate reductase [Actinomycetota bacterium]|jgi:methylenetetrahydrofolate reductase (NADPH)|nr:methylenetetrahydrofolate reductase [Actinomycetota bacterium]
MARIADLLAAGLTSSFEFFPPKTDAEQATLVRTLRELEPLAPSFVSVTYRGGSASRHRTIDLVTGMLRTTTLVPMAHLVCVAHSRLELAEILVELRRAGVENLLALGGDPPTETEAPVGELLHAVELVELARAIGGFSIGVAAHPAGHPAAVDVAEDRRYLAAKLALADFAITQFFFAVEDYAALVEDLRALGVTKPVLPGIMPVTSLRSVPRMAQMGTPVPPWMVVRLQEAADTGGEEAVRATGVALAIDLCRSLLEAGVPGLHFYTLNQSSATRDIYTALELAPTS